MLSYVSGRQAAVELPQPTWGGLSQRLHAIDQAHQWQIEVLLSQEKSAAWPVVRDLLIALNATIEDCREIDRIKFEELVRKQTERGA